MGAAAHSRWADIPFKRVSKTTYPMRHHIPNWMMAGHDEERAHPRQRPGDRQESARQLAGRTPARSSRHWARSTSSARNWPSATARSSSSCKACRLTRVNPLNRLSEKRLLHQALKLCFLRGLTRQSCGAALKLGRSTLRLGFFPPCGVILHRTSGALRLAPSAC
jgi:hypothetical protein